MRRITASCCQSFSPNTATCGRTAWKSLVTTVVTPRKWPGRVRPQSGSVSPGHLDGGGEALGVHGARGRRVDHVDAGGGALRDVVVERPRIALEVVAPVELHRVHEDRDDDALGVASRHAHQLEVALVQRAHGGHERDAPARRALAVRPRLHGVRRRRRSPSRRAQPHRDRRPRPA